MQQFVRPDFPRFKYVAPRHPCEPKGTSTKYVKCVGESTGLHLLFDLKTIGTYMSFCLKSRIPAVHGQNATRSTTSADWCRSIGNCSGNTAVLNQNIQISPSYSTFGPYPHTAHDLERTQKNCLAVPLRVQPSGSVGYTLKTKIQKNVPSRLHSPGVGAYSNQGYRSKKTEWSGQSGPTNHIVNSTRAGNLGAG